MNLRENSWGLLKYLVVFIQPLLTNWEETKSKLNVQTYIKFDLKPITNIKQEIKIVFMFYPLFLFITSLRRNNKFISNNKVG